jgi:hypothetical protein
MLVVDSRFQSRFVYSVQCGILKKQNNLVFVKNTEKIASVSRLCRDPSQ